MFFWGGRRVYLAMKSVRLRVEKTPFLMREMQQIAAPRIGDTFSIPTVSVFRQTTLQSTCKSENARVTGHPKTKKSQGYDITPA